MNIVRGTRILYGEQVDKYNKIISTLRSILEKYRYKEIILPILWKQDSFIKKAGKDILNTMYTFDDKKGRLLCLIPEATALIQEYYNEMLAKSTAKPIRIYYISRCYRYERPQMGRYREFTQFGAEILGNKNPDEEKDEIIKVLKECVDALELDYTFKSSVKRGLSYYIEDGFEIEVDKLGAQKQIAGGGRYKEGIGWAIGVDRLMLCDVKI